MPEIKRINHIAVLVEDIDTSLKFWHDILGIAPSHVSDIPHEAARVAFLPLGESEIELVQPTTSDFRFKPLPRKTWSWYAPPVPRS